MHAELVFCVAEAGWSVSLISISDVYVMYVVDAGDLLSVPIANLEDSRACFDGAGNVLGCARAGADRHFAGGDDVLALVVDHGVCSWFHGGRGKAA